MGNRLKQFVQKLSVLHPKKRFHFHGRVFAENGGFPVEGEIEAASNAEALKKSQTEADRIFLIDRNRVTLSVLDENHHQIGWIYAPSENLARPCEFCPDRNKKPARYRISWHDSSAEACEDCIESEEDRRQDYEKGILVGIQDIWKNIPLDPITLKPLGK